MPVLQGSRFAILHGDGPRPTFSMYSMKDNLKSSVRGVSLVGSIPNKQSNLLCWSPQGKYIVLGGLKVSLTSRRVGDDRVLVRVWAGRTMASTMWWVASK